jgi:predicted DNA-binding transcriptional regulator AlpA
MYVACRIAEKYRNRLPTPKELVSDLGMSRATAYRWLRAIKDARGLA